MPLQIESMSSPESLDVITSFLRTHASGVLVTSDKSANPYGATVYFQFHDDLTITFATKTETQKYKNMNENDQVAFVVYNEEEQVEVQITGHVMLIEDPSQRLQVINNMYIVSPKLSMSTQPPAEKLFAGDYMAMRLVPTVIKMAVYARPDSEGDDDLYETLLLSES